jgi:DNA-directed RNA polymerase specialized sigma subunit
MNVEQIATHMAARYGDPEKYNDLYQEAWVAILEASSMGLSEKDMYWHVRNHVSRYYNYKDRTVSLPARGGQSHLLEKHEIENNIQDHVATSGDHAADFEWKSEVEHLKKNVAKLPREEQWLIDQIYYKGKSYRQLQDEYGYSKSLWQKRHISVLNKLKSGQEAV